MSENFYPEELEQLIELLRGLPGIGRRGAERIALAMLKWDPEKLITLGAAVAALPDKLGPCPECGGLAPRDRRCKICAAPGRDRRLLCVVEDPTQMYAIEKGGFFRGLYLVLGGKLSPLDLEHGENLNTAGLLARAAGDEVEEVILALSSDVEGRATAIYLAELLKEAGVRISRPALGLPAGASFSYADAATISAAFSGRRELS